jgi:hypothetical protein
MHINLQCIDELFPEKQWISFGMTTLFVLTENDDEYGNDCCDPLYAPEGLDDKDGEWYQPVPQSHLRQLIASWFQARKHTFSSEVLREVICLAIHLRAIDHKAKNCISPKDYHNKLQTSNDGLVFDLQEVQEWEKVWGQSLTAQLAPLWLGDDTELTPDSEF